MGDLEKPKHDDRIIKLINQIFGLFFALCRNFDNYYLDPEKLKAEKTQWYMRFKELGLTDSDHISKGIDKTRIQAPVNPPRLSEFIEWCSLIPLLEEPPPFEIAYKECCLKSHPSADKSKWSHVVVYHSWQEMGSFNFSSKPEALSRKMYAHYYQYTLEQYKAGKELKSIPLAIEAPKQDDDPWKTLKKYGGILPQYAHLKTRDEAMPIILELLNKNGGVLKRVRKC